METHTHETTSTSEVRPFHINVPEEDLVLIRRVLDADAIADHNRRGSSAVRRAPEEVLTVQLPLVDETGLV